MALAEKRIAIQNIKEGDANFKNPDIQTENDALPSDTEATDGRNRCCVE